jgi:hypothetical protein
LWRGTSIIIEIFRGEDIGDLANEAGTLQAPPHQRTHRYTPGKYRNVVEGFRGRAPNLRLLPYKVEWDEQLFLAQAVEEWSVRAGVVIFDEEKQRAWVECARRWEVHGV